MNEQLIPLSYHAKLQEVTMENALKFYTCEHGICKKVIQKLHAFCRLRSYLGSNKSKVLLNAIVLSNFSYSTLIWLFCSKADNNELNGTHKCALRTQYRDYESKFEGRLKETIQRQKKQRTYEN